VQFTELNDTMCKCLACARDVTVVWVLAVSFHWHC